VSCHFSASAVLSPGTNWIGGGVDPRVGAAVVLAKSEIPAPARNRALVSHIIGYDFTALYRIETNQNEISRVSVSVDFRHETSCKFVEWFRSRSAEGQTRPLHYAFSSGPNARNDSKKFTF
jgi:hypothetical protein